MRADKHLFSWHGVQRIQRDTPDKNPTIASGFLCLEFACERDVRGLACS
jgi:hypothetical protein